MQCSVSTHDRHGWWKTVKDIQASLLSSGLRNSNAAETENQRGVIQHVFG